MSIHNVYTIDVCMYSECSRVLYIQNTHGGQELRVSHTCKVLHYASIHLWTLLCRGRQVTRSWHRRALLQRNKVDLVCGPLLSRHSVLEVPPALCSKRHMHSQGGLGWSGAAGVLTLSEVVGVFCRLRFART